MWQRTFFGGASILFFLAIAPAWSQEKKEDPPEVQNAIKAVREYLDTKGAKGAGDITWKSAAAVKQSLPDYHVINARFRVYPIARLIPDGLRASNLFAVNKDGKLQHLKDVKTLETFLRAYAPAVKNEKDARTLLAAWLTLTQEFHQDGFFKFEVLEKEFAVQSKDERKVSGRMMVMSGGNGSLSATLLIDKDGKLAKATEESTIRPGPRPICQATKLLDADPIVRRIAEQDLLIMGLPARDYLMEQRDRAKPDLRQAIDRLWAHIQRNGW
jgi:hypothetical protein